jgi:two-component system nitrate/nitrite sensor histidine kinase NarX
MLAQPPGERNYNLPIFFNEQQIGMLKLEYPSSNLPDPSEMRVLKSALPLIGLALEGALLQSLAAEQAAASQTERQQIAQHLHDTLAQNISYLRLKLDQLTGENAIREIGVVLQELERMRASADEAYQQVRNTLDELNPIAEEDVLALVVRQAEVIAERAQFKLQAWQSGVAYPLPSRVRRQILYVAREALHNVEKHAFASTVRLQLIWLENELIIKFTDDGIGFSPSSKNDGHYGLWIMQQRAQEIGGTLKISPAEEHGTEVTLWVPRPDYRNPPS